MEEEQRYVATLGNVPEEDRDYLKARSCVVAISVGGDAHEGEKFRATMKMVNLRFKKCVISVNDILQRYSFAAKDPLQRETEEFYEHSKGLGDEWLERNLLMIQEELKIPFKIIRWDDYLKHPKFKGHSEEVNELFKRNQEYRDIIKNAAKDFLTRNIDKLNINISPDRFCKLSEEYLLEECAAFLDWIDQKYDYELYPSASLDFVERTFRFLRPEESRKIGHLLKIRIQKAPNNKDYLVENSEELALKNIMEIIPENIYWKDKHGSFLGCNFSQAKRANYDSVDKIIGKTVFDTFDYETALQIRNNDLCVMKNNKKIVVEEIEKTNGKDRYFLSYKQPLRDKNNQVIGTIGLSVDITEKKMQEQDLITKNALLKESLAARDQLLNNVSHEIKTPLSCILSVTDTLYHNWDAYTDSKRKEHLSIAVKSNERLRSILVNLLDLSHINAGKITYRVEKYSLSQSARDVVSEFIDFKHRFIIDDRIGDIEAVYDPPRIEQVIRNFLANALRYGGKEDFRIIIEQENDDLLRLSVIDKGVGIPETELEAIFEMFTQSSRTKTRAGGTGIGLSICKKIIHDHGGIIAAKNNEDKGSCFWITLPIKSQIPQDKIKPLGPMENYDSEKMEANMKKPLALIIDDDINVLNSATMTLEALGFRAITANGGIEGIKKLRDTAKLVSVVLLDVMMPDVYGLDLLKQIKSDDNIKHIAIFMHSGFASLEEIKEAQKLGAAGYIDKVSSNQKSMREKLKDFLPS